MLEARQCCHRDLSCGNVFLDLQTLGAHLIDFDSLYHPGLTMPRGTTCGTTGYTSHLAWNNGQLDAARTWCEGADRYALAILNVEFLLLDRTSADTNEGGIFDQEELRQQGGPGLNTIVSVLQTAHPVAAQLLESAVVSTSFEDCPPPGEWIRFFDTVAGPAVKPPGLSQLAAIGTSRMADVLTPRRAAAPLWPAPDLSQMPLQPLVIPKRPQIQLPQVSLPPDPWIK
jgi:serine/threonine protein kinase